MDGHAHAAMVGDGDTALAYDLSGDAQRGPLVFVDATGARLDGLAAAARFFAPGLEVLTLPAWDTLPYDRAAPSAEIVGRRVATLARIAAAPDAPRLLLTTARALLQRVPPPGTWRDAAITLAAGDAIDPDGLRDRLTELGYVTHDVVDAHGDIAFHANTADVFPGDAATPARLVYEDGRIAAIEAFDPATQRSIGRMDGLTLLPVREYAADEPPELIPVLDYLPGVPVVLHAQAEERWADWTEAAADAHAALLRAGRAGADGAAYVPQPSALFVAADAMPGALGGRALRHLPEPAAPTAGPLTLAALTTRLREASDGRTIVAAGAAAARIAAKLARRGIDATFHPDWAAALAQDRGVACIPLDAADGFLRDGVRLLPLREAARRPRSAGLPAEEPPRVGDIVVHREHGVCRLAGLTAVEDEERVALEFANGTDLLIPVAELDAVWRYGSDGGTVGLDRLHGAAWHQRRDEIAAEIAATAQALIATATARDALTAPEIAPPPKRMARFVARFPYPPSDDQQAAIDETLADLARPRPMDRLICGDVGFGKTEVALRAAAAVALAGHQVAIVAPTTLLADQHLRQFRQRFQGLGIRVEGLARGAAKAARAGLADGSVHIVVGTHAVAADAVRFKDLALVVIDEEQRFGDAHKSKLLRLRDPGRGVHALTMSATPIPRTLQGAMVGLRAISVIATPPQQRRPTRTFVVPFDDIVVREAVLRERRRGGQTFCVVPRIEDLTRLADRLRALLPECAIATAHGRQKPEALEQTVRAFGAGEYDVLLATNIIEAGLDLPNANTMLITRPDRFGLSQLHQMRGRVGRGSRRGCCYLLSDPARPLAPATERRLRTLEAREGLGEGLAIATADLDARGAGELFGEKQAGHVHAIGTELYQHLLADCLARLRGEPPAPPPPDLHLGVTGRIPEDYVPEPDLRLDLYRRLVRVADAAALDGFADELEDRFGPPPAPLRTLIATARLGLWARGCGVARVDAGPQAVAFTPQGDAATLAAAIGPGATVKGERVLLALSITDASGRLSALLASLCPAPDDQPSRAA